MLFQITYVNNGREGKTMVRADTEEGAMEKFLRDWAEYEELDRDAIPFAGTAFVTERWEEQS